MIPKGAKTEARLKKLEEILREKGHAATESLSDS
jgi:hypothetical protein